MAKRKFGTTYLEYFTVEGETDNSKEREKSNNSLTLILKS